jgi:hypothetical protein
MKTADSNNSELLLRAFRYFNDEMNVSEQAEFEQQLGSDLATQEALADVVVIQESLLANGDLVQIRANASSASLSKVAALLVTAASIAAIILSSTLSPRSKDSSQTHVAARTEDVEAVSLWTLMGRERDETETDVDANVVSIAATEIDVPDWMFAAVEASDHDEDLDILNFDDDEETL